MKKNYFFALLLCNILFFFKFHSYYYISQIMYGQWQIFIFFRIEIIIIIIM